MAASRWQTFALGAAAALVALSASAHHSFAIFDHSKSSTLNGKVVSFQWTNPHGYLAMDVPDGDKGATRYTIELTSINMLKRAGWRSTDVKPGDEVTAVIAPLLSGEPGGLLLELNVPDGRTLVPPVPGINTFKRTP
ncbi:MAG TPA: DUF6152 family protein [Gammaproteobacteria bacterium]|nr:DUF6152 family protein [Gammaproteobacteria bacterium]